MPKVFVERELTARKGRKRTKLHLRVFAPDLDRPDHPCAFEVIVDGDEWWSKRRVIYGGDSVQALLLTMQMVALRLFLFERDRGMLIDAEDWMHLVDHLRVPRATARERARVAEIKAELREQMREYVRQERKRKQLAAAAGRKTERRRRG